MAAVALSGEKRHRDSDDREPQQAEKRQRPSLPSVVMEAVKLDSLQKLCSTLEPLLRKVVGEEVERALAKLAPSRLAPGRSSPKRVQVADAKALRLQFRSKLALPLFTGSRVEGEQGTAIHIVLQDANTGDVVSSGPEASAKLEIVVLEGDFAVDDEEDWTQEEFEQYVVRERDGRRPLLTGELLVTLKEGVGTVGELTFTDNSSWIRSRKFRLGIRISSGQIEGVRVREAKTDAFTVKDHRGELYKKHYPPALQDEVWRLDRIGKDGAFHKRLNQAGIFTVEDFLRLSVMDPQKLRNILGSGMSNKMWEGTVEHAKTCVLNGKLHVYYADEEQNIGVIFNNIFQLMGLIASNHYIPVDDLSESEKVYVDKLVKVAYEHWENVVEYDGEALTGVNMQKITSSINTRTEEPPLGQQASQSAPSPAREGMPLQKKSSVVDRCRDSGWSDEDHFPAGALLMPAVNTGPSGGDNFNYEERGKIVPQNNRNFWANQAGTSQDSGHSSDHPQISVTQAGQQIMNALGGSGRSQLLQGALRGDYAVEGSSAHISASRAPSAWPQGHDAGPAPPLGPPDTNNDELLSEEELRRKSMQILSENDDMHQQMQQLLAMLGDMGATPTANLAANLQGDGYEILQGGIFAPLADMGINIGGDRPRTNGKANIGWLKLKAALRWGIFIRKRAAARRARIEEVEDEDD
eukprot:SM000219S06664  [mRNA]  locus=s219:34130:38220:+ [translate_table: standard]